METNFHKENCSEDRCLCCHEPTPPKQEGPKFTAEKERGHWWVCTNCGAKGIMPHHGEEFEEKKVRQLCDWMNECWGQSLQGQRSVIDQAKESIESHERVERHLIKRWEKLKALLRIAGSHGTIQVMETLEAE